MTARVPVLLWTDRTDAYRRAIEEVGLANRVELLTLARAETPTPDQLARTEALMAVGAPAGLLPRFARLRWAQAMTAGVEGWLALPDLPAGLALTCARGTHTDSMPENILGALFFAAKPYRAAMEAQRESRWVASVAEPLRGKTLGILGVGAIGAEVARLASAFGIKVVGTRRTPDAVPHVERILPPEGSDEVLAQADFVLLLLPATPATDNFIDAARLARMKSTAWLLNFGRGHTIRDEDLVAAVSGKRIAGAVLDVFRQEPLPAAHPFWTTPGIHVLPHIGGPHPRRDSFVAALFVDNLRRFLDGAPLRELVDRSRGY
ncbi:MAG: D-2-hydroxyacid dehydrogenase [Alphaproteobacteria bacterium]|nr:D-2-hydroxyacid dehydrogenase [Alphaproteobacteria bacterium]